MASSTGANARPQQRRALSVRTRTTLAAVLVVAVMLVVAALALLLTVRESLRDAAESSAEQRADDLVTALATTPPAALDLRVPGSDSDSGTSGDDPEEELDGELDGEPEDEPEDEPGDEADDVVWQVVDASGAVVAASQELPIVLTAFDDDTVDLPGSDHPYVLASEDVDGSGLTVVVAVSLEDAADGVSALLTPLLVGVPCLLLVLGSTTWVVVGRALAPVERIRREAALITGDQLSRRVPEPAADDEVGRLARTMNAMLARLQAARVRQEQFVGDASHELRSPIASLRQAAEVARAHPTAMPQGELAETVLEESVRMQHLVEQLLTLTRVGEGHDAPRRADVDVDDLALAEARRIARPGLDVETTGIGPARVRGDRVALAQVVRNLVANAARHASTTVSVAVREEQDTVVLVVEDDGSGVPAADRLRVFERFVRLDEARARDAGGSGLGLAIVREVVLAHGGSVEVETATSGGARFVVRLPAVS